MGARTGFVEPAAADEFAVIALLPNSPHDAVQCSFTCGSVRRVIILAAVSSVTFQKPCNASSCILYSDRYIIRANHPSIQRLWPARPPIRFPTTEYSPSETSEPKSR